MRWFSEKQWAMVEDKSDLTPEEIPIYYATKEKLDALRSAYYQLESNLDGYLMKVLRKIEAAKREIRLCKAKHDAILEELGTTHNMPNRQQMLSVCAAWEPWWDAPDYFYESETGLRLDITPGPTHEWHAEWKQRLLECRTTYGPAGPPPYPPFNRSAAWETRSATRDHPFPLYWEPDSERQLAWEKQQNEKNSDGKKGQLREKHVEKGADLDLGSEPEEAGPSDIMKALAHLEHYANDQPEATTDHNNPRALPPAQVAEQSGSTTRSSKRDKGKGKAVDPPSISIKSNAAPIAATTSTSAGPSRSSAPAPIAASGRSIASTSAATTKNISRTANGTTKSAAVTKGNPSQGTMKEDGEKNTTVAEPRTLRIKIKSV
ncbi:hypothetical protein B0T20DRAFT_495932 [Sordaria brevicollis]|uniref:Uncharacterized protein n=1 Tax=Sordaria brevicollis TaxID=83679 RepID=A0AAE0PH62_SORBR|nr:hypothetical protein B0T20DRAFT_495932 [Sordaria brevicollis]